MHIYAIGDLHLSGEPASKPMEVFDEHWRNHKEKVAANWQNTVTAQDTIIAVSYTHLTLPTILRV